VVKKKEERLEKVEVMGLHMW